MSSSVYENPLIGRYASVEMSELAVGAMVRGEDAQDQLETQHSIIAASHHI